jgi:hypothetical protein
MLSEIDYRNVVTFDLVSYVSLNSAIETRRRFKATVRCVGISLQNSGIRETYIANYDDSLSPDLSMNTLSKLHDSNP